MIVINKYKKDKGYRMIGRYIINFDIDKYNGSFAMHCKTEEEAELFCEFLTNRRINRYWQNGSIYYRNTNYNTFKENTIYYFNEGVYGDINKVKEEYKVLKWDDFYIYKEI